MSSSSRYTATENNYPSVYQGLLRVPEYLGMKIEHPWKCARNIESINLGQAEKNDSNRFLIMLFLSIHRIKSPFKGWKTIHELYKTILFVKGYFLKDMLQMCILP